MIVRTVFWTMHRDKLTETVAGMLAEAEKHGYSYPLQVTVDLADGRRMTDVLYGDRSVASISGSRLLPATVELREWGASTGKPGEERALRTKVYGTQSGPEDRRIA